MARKSSEGPFVVFSKSDYNVTGEWFVRLRDDDLLWDFGVHGAGLVAWTSPAVIGEEYFVVCWYKQSNGEIGIQVNHGAPATVTASGPKQGPETTIPLVVGGVAGASRRFIGPLAGAGLWKKVVSAEERTSLYNGGRGKRWQDLSAGERTSLKVYYNLDD